jgi:hypothetical protein
MSLRRSSFIGRVAPVAVAITGLGLAVAGGSPGLAWGLIVAGLAYGLAVVQKERAPTRARRSPGLVLL